MYHRPIRSTCFRSSHFFPVRMRYAGWRFWRGRTGHLMVCPACNSKKLFTYVTPVTYRQVI